MFHFRGTVQDILSKLKGVNPAINEGNAENAFKMLDEAVELAKIFNEESIKQNLSFDTNILAMTYAYRAQALGTKNKLSEAKADLLEAIKLLDDNDKYKTLLKQLLTEINKKIELGSTQERTDAQLQAMINSKSYKDGEEFGKNIITKGNARTVQISSNIVFPEEKKAPIHPNDRQVSLIEYANILTREAMDISLTKAAPHAYNIKNKTKPIVPKPSIYPSVQQLNLTEPIDLIESRDILSAKAESHIDSIKKKTKHIAWKAKCNEKLSDLDLAIACTAYLFTAGVPEDRDNDLFVLVYESFNAYDLRKLFYDQIVPTLEAFSNETMEMIEFKHSGKSEEERRLEFESTLELSDEAKEYKSSSNANSSIVQNGKIREAYNPQKFRELLNYKEEDFEKWLRQKSLGVTREAMESCMLYDPTSECLRQAQLLLFAAQKEDKKLFEIMLKEIIARRTTYNDEGYIIINNKEINIIASTAYSINPEIENSVSVFICDCIMAISTGCTESLIDTKNIILNLFRDDEEVELGYNEKEIEKARSILIYATTKKNAKYDSVGKTVLCIAKFLGKVSPLIAILICLLYIRKKMRKPNA